MNVFITALLTFLALILVFGSLYFQLRGSKRGTKIAFILFLVVSAVPLAYLLIDDYMQNYQDANIGLGLAFFYTWFMIVIAALLAFICILRMKRREEKDYRPKD